MKQKYLLTASAFYTWLFTAPSPSTNCPLSSLMTHLIYLGKAPVKEVKMFSLAPAPATWRRLLSLVQCVRKKKQQTTKQQHKTKPKA